MLKTLIAILSGAILVSCASIVNDPNVPVTLSFSDGSSGNCKLNNKRASEKTNIARNDVKAIRANYEAKGMGVEKLVKKEIDVDDGTPKNGVETLEITFKRVMGREMNLTWTKPQHYNNNHTLPNPIETAKEECLGGNCNVSPVDEKNDRLVKILAKRKLVAAQPLPSNTNMLGKLN